MVPNLKPAKEGDRVAAGYVAPRLSFGQPDLQGVWSNASNTRMTKPGNLKSVVMTDEEEAVARANNPSNIRQATDDNQNIGDGLLDGKDLASGRGYNSFWIDPGSTYANVKGTWRASWIVDPPSGQVPFSEEGRKLSASLRGGRGRGRVRSGAQLLGTDGRYGGHCRPAAGDDGRGPGAARPGDGFGGARRGSAGIGGIAGDAGQSAGVGGGLRGELENSSHRERTIAHEVRLSLQRHAEFISASISRHKQLCELERWILKQVQDDGEIEGRFICHSPGPWGRD